MLSPVLLLLLLGAAAASPELDAFLQVTLQSSARAAVVGELDPLLLRSGRVISGLSGLRVEGLERVGKHWKFYFTARIPVLHVSTESSKGVVLLHFRNLHLSFLVHLEPSGSSFVLSSLSALPFRLADSRTFVSGLARRPGIHKMVDYIRSTQHHLLALFKSRLQDALGCHTIAAIHAGRFSFDDVTHDSRRVRAAKDAVAAAMVALRDRRPFFWRDGWRRFRLTTGAIFAEPEASPRPDALLLQLELEGLRLVERREGRVRRVSLGARVLVAVRARGISVRLTGLEGRADDGVLEGLLAWTARELTPALGRALFELRP